MNKILFFCTAILASLHHSGTRGLPSCSPYQILVDDKCVCRSYHADCNGFSEDGCETSLLDDAGNCGSCGQACSDQQECVQGVCRPPCDAGFKRCNQICINIMNDEENCGECGNRCDQKEVCSFGACVCDTGMTECDSSCVDLMTDGDNCGECAHSCGTNEICSSGACVCDTGMTECDSSCVDLQSDDDNCGECGISCEAEQMCSGGICTWKPLIFSVMGDIPVESGEKSKLQGDIQKHNSESPSKFMVHIGDIKDGESSCTENKYQEVASILHQLDVPTFIIPGDNEYNDCSDPNTAFGYWKDAFLYFESYWQNAPDDIEHQSERHENFAWVQRGVLLVGINLVGGEIKDQNEWNQRLSQDADWVEQQFSDKGDQVYAAVVFAHANKDMYPSGNFDSFFNRFFDAAHDFGHPVLFIHGDGHYPWIKDKHWHEDNVTRVQVVRGGWAPPVQVTTSPEDSDTFSFDQHPF